MAFAPVHTSFPLFRWGVRRWLYRGLLLVSLLGLLEVGSMQIFRFRDGEAFSVSRLQRERKKLLRRAEERQIDPESSTAYIVHPYLGTVLNPRWPFPLPGENPITEYGFTDTGPPIHHRDPHKLLVGMVGGSVASQFCCQGAATLKDRLHKVPAYRDKEIVFINLAVPGYKQPQQVMALNYVLAMGGEFDLLINIDGFNEVALYPPENWPKNIFPLFPRGWHLVTNNLPDPTTRRLTGKFYFALEAQENWARAFMGWARFSPTLNLLWRIRDQQLKARAKACMLELQAYTPKYLPHCATGPKHGLKSEEEMYQELVRIWQRCSLQLHRICQAHGIRYYHFLQPNQYDPGSKPLGPREKQIAWLADQPLRAGVLHGYPLLRKAGKHLIKQGVRYHDLTQIFSGHPEVLYLDTCCHLNGEGNQVLAEAIAPYLVETSTAK